MRVRTHHYDFDIIFAEKSDPEWNETRPDDVDATDNGYTDFDHERIVVRADLNSAMQADTVLHEVLHLATEAGGKADSKKKMTEEQWVCHATAGLKQMLVLDNDELFEYLGVAL